MNASGSNFKEYTENKASGEAMPFYFTNKRWYMILISIVVGYTTYHDNHTQYAIMMKAKSPFYVLLSFINTFANFYINVAIMMENMICSNIVEIFMNFAGLFVVAQIDNMVADFVILYVPEREDEDFLELPFDKETDDRSIRIVRV